MLFLIKDMQNKRHNKTILKMASLLTPVISSRDIVITVLTETLKKTNTILVVLDFLDVDFISRSAAQSILSISNDFTHSFFRKKSISFVNTNKNVSQMFHAVKINKTNTKGAEASINSEAVSIDTLLQKYHLKVNA